MNFVCKNPKCGKLVYLNDKICPYCGIATPAKNSANDGAIPIMLVVIVTLLLISFILFLIKTMVGGVDLLEFFGVSQLSDQQTHYFTVLHCIILLRY